ncbi:DNA-dependent ATPase protein rad54 [Pycnococcus provasolii]|uniref:DNA-dependent ATPase protein rad54 n=1 Tax=Pycnococcus provasolii TaxID=41880 RepID=A0A830HPC5_9CHLO|nr:DNA-dependent ATPase protein rad54 [Pycnococcus provasolii]
MRVKCWRCNSKFLERVDDSYGEDGFFCPNDACNYDKRTGAFKLRSVTEVRDAWEEQEEERKSREMSKEEKAAAKAKAKEEKLAAKAKEKEEKAVAKEKQPASGDGGADGKGSTDAVDDDDDDDDDGEFDPEVEEDDKPLAPEVAKMKAMNIAALKSNTLATRSDDAYLPPSVLQQNPHPILWQPFKPPSGCPPEGSLTLQRRLAQRRRFIPWAMSRPFKVSQSDRDTTDAGGSDKEWRESGDEEEEEEEDKGPPPGEPLQLYNPVTWMAEHEAAKKETSKKKAKKEASGEVVAEEMVVKPMPPPEDAVELTMDTMISRWLRPHQREGVKFMFECVSGMRRDRGLYDGCGCILADDMGLGKTLQGIALLYTLLNKGIRTSETPMAKRVIIVCPTSLVNNWDAEVNKWLTWDKKVHVKTLPLCESTKSLVMRAISDFIHPQAVHQVMILSYETFRIHHKRFLRCGMKKKDDPAAFLAAARQGGPCAASACDLLICDEAHRLKNGQTATNKALMQLPCRRRVLLSGTPMQNKLDEFYSMVHFTNPGVLGTVSQFRRRYEVAILRGREPDSSDADRKLGSERSAELSHLVKPFILRRTNKVLSDHLPPKVVEIVCVGLTDFQKNLYRKFLETKAMKHALTGKQTMVLSAITTLKKICNHPRLIYDDVVNDSKGQYEELQPFFEQATRAAEQAAAAAAAACAADPNAARGRDQKSKLLKQLLAANRSFQSKYASGRGGKPKPSASVGMLKASLTPGWEMESGKMAVLTKLLDIMRANTDDRVVLVSNYTSALDLFECLCENRNYPYVRLDGSTSIKKRMQLVREFNDPANDQFAFLLSSKAGGCGLNLVGANRLVLFDPDWNPANDKQAAGRVWRDGQKKRVFVYRFVASGSIEEKVFQRQLSKEGLQNMVGQAAEDDAAPAKKTVHDAMDLDGEDSDGEDADDEDVDQQEEEEEEEEEESSEEEEEGKGGDPAKMALSAFSANELKDLFKLDEETWSSTYDSLGQDKSFKPPPPPAPKTEGDEDEENGEEMPAVEVQPAAESMAIVRRPPEDRYVPLSEQVGKPTEDDLSAWGMHYKCHSVPDPAMTAVGYPEVSFIFSCKVDGKPLSEEEKKKEEKANRLHHSAAEKVREQVKLEPPPREYVVKPTAAPPAQPPKREKPEKPGKEAAKTKVKEPAAAPPPAQPPKQEKPAAAAPAQPPKQEKSAAAPPAQPPKQEKPAAAPLAPVATNISDPLSAGAQASKLKLLKRPRPSVVDADSSDSDFE